MSRGPGKIERAISDLLEANPAGTFILPELVAAAYPDLEYYEKKHSVSIWRAVHNIKLPDNSWWRIEAALNLKGVPYILHNRLNLRSLGVASERGRLWPIRKGYGIEEPQTDKEAETQCLSPQSRSYPYVLEDGPLPALVEYYRARVKGDKAEAERLWKVYTGRWDRADNWPKGVTGQVHPDFLRNCVTISVPAHDGDTAHNRDVSADLATSAS